MRTPKWTIFYVSIGIVMLGATGYYYKQHTVRREKEREAVIKAIIKQEELKPEEELRTPQANARYPDGTSNRHAQKRIDIAKAEILDELFDPASAILSNVYYMHNTHLAFHGAILPDGGEEVVCATVNAKNRFGGYVGKELRVYHVTNGLIISAERSHNPLFYYTLCTPREQTSATIKAEEELVQQIRRNIKQIRLQHRNDTHALERRLQNTRNIERENEKRMRELQKRQEQMYREYKCLYQNNCPEGVVPEMPSSKIHTPSIKPRSSGAPTFVLSN